MRNAKNQTQFQSPATLSKQRKKGVRVAGLSLCGDDFDPEFADGGVDYKTGKIIYKVTKTKSGQKFLVFLIALVTAYAGRKIRLVCDNGRFHHTKAVRQWLRTHRDQIEVFWLPPYCPSLNLIERLWDHLKRTVLANVLFATMEDLVAAFRRGVVCVNGNRKKDGIYV